MTLFEVTTAGLGTLADQCRAWSSGVAVASTPGVPAAEGRASATAVAAIHSRVGLGGETLSSRMGATAGKLTSAADAYTVHDDESAAEMVRLI